MNWSAIAQVLGGIFYPIALAVSTGQIPIDQKYAPYVALAGMLLRTLTNSNAAVPPTPPPAPPAKSPTTGVPTA